MPLLFGLPHMLSISRVWNAPRESFSSFFPSFLMRCILVSDIHMMTHWGGSLCRALKLVDSATWFFFLYKLVKNLFDCSDVLGKLNVHVIHLESRWLRYILLFSQWYRVVIHLCIFYFSFNLMHIFYWIVMAFHLNKKISRCLHFVSFCSVHVYISFPNHNFPGFNKIFIL